MLAGIKGIKESSNIFLFPADHSEKNIRYIPPQKSYCVLVVMMTAWCAVFGVPIANIMSYIPQANWKLFVVNHDLDNSAVRTYRKAFSRHFRRAIV